MPASGLPEPRTTVHGSGRLRSTVLGDRLQARGEPRAEVGPMNEVEIELFHHLELVENHVSAVQTH